MFCRLRLLFIMLILLLHTAIFAGIKGRVINAENQPVPYAFLIVQQLPDSTVLKTEVATVDGFFDIDITPDTNTLLKVAAAGYIIYYRKLAADTDLGDIILGTDTRMLSEVTITSAKPLIERKVDRMVLNVESSIAAIGADAFEMLKKAPGVRTDQNKIGMVGKSTVSIMINDKLLRLSGDELEAYLRAIPADQLLRIEVITTPPAKYDAEGNSGIINIVMKKSVADGFNGNLSASYQQRFYGSKKLSGAFNWRKGKLNIYGNGNINSFVFVSSQNFTTVYPNQRLEQHLVQQNSPTYTRGEVGMDYQLSPKSVIGILYNIGGTDAHRKQRYVTDMRHLPTEVIDSVMNTQARNKETALHHQLNLNYEWRIDSNGKKLNIDADYYTRTSYSDRNFVTGNVYSDGTSTGWSGDFSTSGKQHIDISTAKADLELPSSLADFSLGGKVSFIRNTSNNLFSQLQGGDYILDSARSNWFEYTENTQALYVSANKTTGNWEMQVGLRGEYTQTKGVSHSLNQTATNNYFRLFPTAYVQYTPAEQHVFNLNYSRRIDRPNFGELDPFRVYGTAVTYEEGNPFLQPAFSHAVELAYTLNDKYTFTLFTGYVQAVPTFVSIVDSTNNSFYFSMANAGTRWDNGLSITTVFTPFSWWECTVQAYGYYNRFTSSYYNTAVKTYGLPSFSIEAGNNFVLNRQRTLMAELSAEYRARAQDDLDSQTPIYGVDAGFKALLMDKQLIAAVNVWDVFRTYKFQFTNRYNGTVIDNYYDAQCLVLSVVWKFGNRNIKDKRQRNIDSEEINRAN